MKLLGNKSAKKTEDLKIEHVEMNLKISEAEKLELETQLAALRTKVKTLERNLLQKDQLMTDEQVNKISQNFFTYFLRQEETAKSNEDLLKSLEYQAYGRECEKRGVEALRNAMIKDSFDQLQSIK